MSAAGAAPDRPEPASRTPDEPAGADSRVAASTRRPFSFARGEGDTLVIEMHATGDAVLRSPLTNKSTAFTREERIELGLEGLLPPRVETLDSQVARALAAYQREPTPIARYCFLRALQDTNEVLFYALLERNLAEMLPIVYTPTVGEAVQRFSLLFSRPRGLSIARGDGFDPEAALTASTCDDPRIIVATDSSAILGIGDQGYGGLAIPIGKLSLYTVAGGVSPFRTVPAVLDVGTDRDELRGDPLYLGICETRIKGEEYLDFVARFVEAVRQRWPRAIVQWEDLAKGAAFAVLDRFRDVVPSFNDDIQGTGAVALAGLIGAVRLVKRTLAGERFLVYGAGAGGVGVARAIKQGLIREGLSESDARARIFVLDSKGLLVESRSMESYKREFAQPDAVASGWKVAGAVPTLEETVRGAGITALLGLSGQPGTFTESVVRALGDNVDRPIVFALSNPTSACEATPDDVVRWTSGRAVVATGSPFEPVVHDGKTYVIGQGNNAFIFPGLGFGAILCEARAITDGMVSDAAYALADYNAERWLDRGMVYPPVEDLREASVRVAARVLQRAVADGVARRTTFPDDLEGFVRRKAWSARYLPFRRASK